MIVNDKFQCILDTKLKKPEQIEWIDTNKKDIIISFKQYYNSLSVSISMWQSYRADTGQCGGEVVSEYIIDEEKFNFNRAYDVGSLIVKDIVVEDVTHSAITDGDKVLVAEYTRPEVISAVEREITELNPKPEPEPTEQEQLRADVDFLLAMGGVL